MIELPNKLSDLLELAVRDVQKCEAQPARFSLHMGNWHKPDAGKGVCVVCMAGAVMAQTIGIPDQAERFVFEDRACEDDIEPHRRAMSAINEMRIGLIGAAAAQLGLRLSSEQEDAVEGAGNEIHAELPDTENEREYYDDVEDWSNVNDADFRAPWETYLKAAQILREAGL